MLCMIHTLLTAYPSDFHPVMPVTTNSSIEKINVMLREQPFYTLLTEYNTYC